MASARSKARKRALDVLFEAEAKGVDPLSVLLERESRAETPLNPYTRALVEGVGARRAQIDSLLSDHAQGWALERMPAVDRNVLRLGAYEVLWGDVGGRAPEVVAIDEAVGLVRELSTDDSPRFVNGILSRLHSLKPTLVAGGAEPASDSGTDETQPPA